MKIERAKEIGGACLQALWASEGNAEVWPDLSGYSLRDMLYACDKLRKEPGQEIVGPNGEQGVLVFPDIHDAYIAALYVLTHFDDESEEDEYVYGVVYFPDKALVVTKHDTVGARKKKEEEAEAEREQKKQPSTTEHTENTEEDGTLTPPLSQGEREPDQGEREPEPQQDAASTLVEQEGSALGKVDSFVFGTD